MGSIIEKDEVLVVIDAMRLIDQYCFNHNIKIDTSDSAVANKSTNSIHILVVEDSRFFRNHIKSILQSNGFEVSTAENGEDALDQLTDRHDEISLVISDIEMPKMDGYAFAGQVQKDETLQKYPSLLSPLVSDRDIERGMELGFVKYLEKLNEDQLLSTITEVLKEG